MFKRSFEGVWIMLSLKIYWFTIHEIITTSLWGNCKGTKETTCYTICTFFPAWCSDVHSRHASNFETLLRQLAPTKNPSLINAMKAIKNPYKMCERLYKLVQSLTGQLKELINQKVYDPRGRGLSLQFKFLGLSHHSSLSEQPKASHLREPEKGTGVASNLSLGERVCIMEFRVRNSYELRIGIFRRMKQSNSIQLLRNLERNDYSTSFSIDFNFFLFKDPYLYQGETLELMMHRWTKLEKVTFFK